MKVLATGCFDLVHYGHIAFLKQAARLGSILDVGLMTDGYIREEKKREPIYTYEMRAEILQSLACVNEVYPVEGVILDEVYPEMEKLVVKLKPDIIACGREGTASYWAVPLSKKYGSVYVILSCEVLHTTELIEKIKHGN